MNRPDGHFIRDLVVRTQGVTLQAESATRIADLAAAIFTTLDDLAGGPLFDTEPAQFQREMRRLARRAADV